jgi:hypothetical protein
VDTVVSPTLHPNDTPLLPHRARLTRACGAEQPADDHPMLVAVTVLARRHQERAEALQTAHDAEAGDAELAAGTRVLIDCAQARATLTEHRKLHQSIGGRWTFSR